MVELVKHRLCGERSFEHAGADGIAHPRCHVRGRFVCKENRAPRLSTRALIDEPARLDYMRLAHPR